MPTNGGQVIEIPTSPFKHIRAYGSDESPCAVCGRPTNREGGGAQSIRTWYGSQAVTEAEASKLAKTAPGGDTGCYPVGADCLRKHPELLPYVVR